MGDRLRTGWTSVVVGGVLLVFLGLGGCSDRGGRLPPKYAPVRNPQPRQHLVLSGRVAPGLHLTLYAVYVTTRQSCERTVNRFQGVRFPRSTRLDHKVEPTDGGYESRIPLDGLQPGWCQWQFRQIEYTVRTAETLGIEFPRPMPLLWLVEGRPEGESTIHIRCDRRWTSQGAAPSDGAEVPRCDRPRGNYIYPFTTERLVVDVEGGSR